MGFEEPHSREVCKELSSFFFLRNVLLLDDWFVVNVEQ